MSRAITAGRLPATTVNREPFLRVMRKHRDAIKDINAKNVPADLYNAAKQSWDDAVELGEDFGYRNAQATVLAPTGTIGFMMDCDTTGVEPDIALVKYKKLVGGGMMKIVNTTVPMALGKLGYTATQITDIVDVHRSAGDDRGRAAPARSRPGRCSIARSRPPTASARFTTWATSR